MGGEWRREMESWSFFGLALRRAVMTRPKVADTMGPGTGPKPEPCSDIEGVYGY